ncbi:Rv0909 family putative TA system antitoxin [Actinomyces mediterranea]|uniref:Rv0909 family putative TA system antitoxin n=1 Tax=Actinomyces mediterranea TaxID=1871028 RepID=UPI001F23FD8E|nr:Rv0909 family putative TA system antitoxin [Actinomyces mediterranea]
MKITAEGLVEKAEELITDEATTDAVLDAAANAAKKVTGGKLDDKIDAARNVLDDKIGE